MTTEFNFVIKKVSTAVYADLIYWPRPSEPYEIAKIVMPTDGFIALFISLQNGQPMTVVNTKSDPIAIKSLRALAPKEMEPVLNGWLQAHV